MKNRKNLVWLLLAMTMILMVSGCGQTAEETTTAEPETTLEATTEATTEETTPAPTEPSVREVSALKVGMIFYGEEQEGSLLAESLRQEMTEAASAIGMSEDQIVCQYNSREADWTQIEDSILTCVEQGCQLILGCAREYEAVIAAIAEEYPEIMFACVGSELYNGTNSGTFYIDLNVAQYLCGAAAGLKTDTDRVGFLAAKDSDDAMVTDAVNAFAYGVWSTNPEAVVDVGIIGKWFSPGAEAQGTDYLQSLGCDVLGGYTDLSLGSSRYLWRQYFGMKLNQIIQKEVIGEAWVGDYYSNAAICDMAVELPQYVWDKVTEWGPVSEKNPEETQEETVETQEETEETQEETVETQEETEETVESYVIPDIEINGDTGYLTNVRVHEIQWEEE